MAPSLVFPAKELKESPFGRPLGKWFTADGRASQWPAVPWPRRRQGVS